MVSFREKLGKYITDNGTEIAEDLCDGNSLSIITSTCIEKILNDDFGNSYKLKICLIEEEDPDY